MGWFGLAHYRWGSVMALTGTFSYQPNDYITAASQWANDQAAQGRDQYQWAKDQFTKNQGTSDRVVNDALNEGDYWSGAGQQLMQNYMSMYPDAMRQQLQYAQQYGSDANKALARGQAIATVGQSFDQAAKDSSENLESYGLKPQDVSARLDASVRTQRAAASAAAGTESDINRDVVGQQLLSQAIQTGQGMAGVATGATGVGQAARNQAINTGLATTASGSSTMGTPLQWAGMGNEELKEWPKAQQTAQQMGQQFYQAQDQSQQGWAKLGEESSSGIGALVGGLGAAAMKYGPSIAAAFSGGVVPKFSEGGPVGDGALPSFDGSGQPAMPAQAIQTGTVVPPGTGVPGIKGPDKVPALVAEGEGVLPRDVMDWLGEKGFQQLIAKARKERQSQTQTEPQDSSPEAQAVAQRAGPQFASEGAAA